MPPAAVDTYHHGGLFAAAHQAGPVLSTAAGLLALLAEDEPQLIAAAIRQLSPLVPQLWHEIADALPRLCQLAQQQVGEQEGEQQNIAQDAALVASRVFFYTENWSQALAFALLAGRAFTSLIEDSGKDAALAEFVDTLLAKFIDEYTRQKQEAFAREVRGDGDVDVSASASATDQAQGGDVEMADSGTTATTTTATKNGVDSRLEVIVDSMFERTFADGQFKESLGIAIECRRMDYVCRAIRSAAQDQTVPMLEYAQKCALDLLHDRDFRRRMLEAIVEIYREAEQQGKPVNALRICECLVLLDDSEGVAALVEQLLKSGGGDRNSPDTLTAFQLAFNLADSATQQFRTRVSTRLKKAEDMPPAAAASASSSAATDAGEESVLDSSLAILRGDVTVRLHLHFLARHNKADLLVLNQLKQAVEQPRNAVLHSSVVISNALMHAGTTSDKFLRDNLEWLARASNWAKFSAVAGLGVINKGHLTKAQQLLAPYLPGAAGGAGASAYQEGGALYALGLIHANHGAGGDDDDAEKIRGEDVTSFLLTNLAAAAGNEIVQHGACLGLGLTANATRDGRVYDALREVLLGDSAVAGEAAGIAMGLVMSGSQASAEHGFDPDVAEKIEEMLGYARDTQHEKIIRGLSLGVALCVYGQESAADTIIEQMLNEQDPIIRFGGVWAMALAYAGAGAHSGVLQRLLHVAVSAVTDDERRAATTALGFVLHREARNASHGSAANGDSQNDDEGSAFTSQVLSVTGDSSLLPSLVRTLSASFNPHVRYGAAMALGVGFAGTGDAEALNLLRPLAQTDRVDFVRQGALVAGAMVCIQSNDAIQTPKNGNSSSNNKPVFKTAGAAAAAVAAAGGPARLASELLQDQLEKGLPLSVPEEVKKPAAVPESPKDLASPGADASKSVASESSQSKDKKKAGDAKEETDKKPNGAGRKEKEEKPRPKTPAEEEEAALKQIKAAQRPIAAFRQLLHDKANDRREELLCKFGAVVAHGIIDGGGRNATLSLSPISASGATANNRGAVCGMALFLQHWFWHPFAHMLSLAMQPTAVIGLDGSLRLPANFEFDCDANESVFAYPPPRSAQKKTKAKKVKKAVLSTTRRYEQREAEKDGANGSKPLEADADVEMDGAAAVEEASVAAPPEAKSYSLGNPSRVTLTQVPLLRFRGGNEARWRPIHTRFEGGANQDANAIAGIVMLHDTQPAGGDVEYVDTDASKAAAAAAEATEQEEEGGEEPQPPAPFVFDPALED